MEKISSEELKKLLEDISSGSDHAFSKLCVLYEGMIKKLVGSFKESLSMPFDDLYQEALIAFLKAAKTFDTEQNGVSFGLYAKICVKNSLISLGRKEKSRKRRQVSPRNGHSEGAGNDGNGLFADDLESFKGLLKENEFRVLKLFLEGRTYGEIAFELDVSKKKVDNTLYRLRKKLKR